MAVWRTGLRRLRGVLAGTFAAVVIALAVVMALGQLLLPLVSSHPDRLAAILGERLGQTVTVQSATGRWQASGPLLEVTDLNIGDGDNPLHLPQAELKLDFGAWLKRDRRWLELRISDASAKLSTDADGSWHLSGLRLGDKSGGNETARLGDLPVGLLLRRLRLELRDPARQVDVSLEAPVLRLLTRNKRLHLGGQLLPPGGGPPVDLTAWFDPATRAGKLYVSGDGMDLPVWAQLLGSRGARLQQGQGQVRAWLGWQNGRANHLSLDLRLADVILARDGQTPLEMAAWQGLVQAEGDPQAWRLRLQPRPRRSGGEAAVLDMARDADGRLRAQGRGLDLSLLSPWLAWWPELASGPVPALAQLQPWGALQSLDLDWRNATDFSVHAELKGLGWQAAAGLPGVDHLDAQLRGDGRALSLHFPPQPATFEYPGVFREPFAYSRFAGDAAFWQSGSGWHVGSDALELVADNYRVLLRGQLREDPGRDWPLLDVVARVSEAEVPAAKLFWPINVMPESAVLWLDRGLVSGEVAGSALFRGNLEDWPFPDPLGRFEAVADFHDAVLDYDADWPRVDKLEGRASFVNEGMQVTATGGATLGNQTDSARADIDDFNRAVLALDVRGKGDSARLLQWLRQTPIGADHGDALALLRASGPTGYAVKLHLPLDEELDDPAELDGRAQLSGIRFEVPDWSLQLEEIKGQLDFGLDGIHGEGLEASYNKVPVRLGVRVGDAVTQADAALEASMQGRFDAPSLLASYPDLEPLAAHTSGTAAFNIGLRLRSDEVAAARPSQLSVDSLLDGIALHLPAPLAKPAAEPQHLHLELGVPVEGAALAVRLGSIVDAAVRLPDADAPMAVDVALAGKAAAVPSNGVVIHGHAEVLDVGGWLQQLLAGASTSSAVSAPAPIRLDISSGQTLVGDEHLGAVALKVGTNKGDTLIQVDGEALAGEIRIPMSELGRRGITFDFDRLYWPQSGADEEDEGKSRAAVAVAPAAIPPLHVWVRDLRLGPAQLGELRFETTSTSEGMQVEQLEAQSPNLKLSARGRWTGSATDNHTRLSIDLSADDLGRMLSAFGYPRLVAGGTTLTHIDGRWAGPPSAFDLARMDGNIKVRVTDGRILEVEPGVGRLFGLFSIRELPRRLSLDFGDIFQAGYAFNSIDGLLRFADGNAYTDDLWMRGPSADILIRGRTGMRQRDYDEQITVTPHLGVALPVVGAIAGGPVGAAAGLAIQGLLGKGLNRAGEAHYEVTGSWDAPDIRRVARSQDGVPVPAPPPAAADASTPATADSAVHMPSPALSVESPAPAVSVPVPAPAGSASGAAGSVPVPVSSFPMRTD